MSPALPQILNRLRMGLGVRKRGGPDLLKLSKSNRGIIGLVRLKCRLRVFGVLYSSGRIPDMQPITPKWASNPDDFFTQISLLLESNYRSISFKTRLSFDHTKSKLNLYTSSTMSSEEIHVVALLTPAPGKHDRVSTVHYLWIWIYR